MQGHNLNEHWLYIYKLPTREAISKPRLIMYDYVWEEMCQMGWGSPAS